MRMWSVGILSGMQGDTKVFPVNTFICLFHVFFSFYLSLFLVRFFFLLFY